MSYDYFENILVQESIGNLLRDELSWDVQLKNRGVFTTFDCQNMRIYINNRTDLTKHLAQTG